MTTLCDKFFGAVHNTEIFGAERARGINMPVNVKEKGSKPIEETR